MWHVVFLNLTVQDEVAELPRDMQAKFAHIVSLMEGLGLERMHEPYVKHVVGRLWEMRLTGRDGIARAIYVTAEGRRVVIVRAFRKKTRKTPSSEIKLALKRAREIS